MATDAPRAASASATARPTRLAPPVTRATAPRSVMGEGSVIREFGDRPAAGEAVIQRVPEPDGLLAVFPAEADQLALVDREEIHQPGVEVFELAPHGIQLMQGLLELLHLGGAFSRLGLRRGLAGGVHRAVGPKTLQLHPRDGLLQRLEPRPLGPQRGEEGPRLRQEPVGLLDGEDARLRLPLRGLATHARTPARIARAGCHARPPSPTPRPSRLAPSARTLRSNDSRTSRRTGRSAACQAPARTVGRRPAPPADGPSRRRCSAASSG